MANSPGKRLVFIPWNRLEQALFSDQCLLYCWSLITFPPFIALIASHYIAHLPGSLCLWLTPHVSTYRVFQDIMWRFFFSFDIYDNLSFVGQYFYIDFFPS